MSMFDSYNSLGINFENNPHIAPAGNTVYNSIDNELPRKLYNIKGNFIGYEWNYGELFDFVLDVSNKIRVKVDAVIYEVAGECPTTETSGYLGQQAFNTADNKCWTCAGLMDGLYVWMEEDSIYYPEDGVKDLNVKIEENVKKAILNICNFRWEPVKTFEAENCSQITCPIDLEANKVLVPGVYYSTLEIETENGKYLKDRFIVHIR